MKTKFLLSLAALLTATGAWSAETYTVTTAAEFATAWGKLADGDTIVLGADIVLSGVELAPCELSGVTLTSAEGGKYTLSVAPPLGNVALNNVMLQNSQSTEAPLVSIDEEVTFSNGVEIAYAGGGAVRVEKGGVLNIRDAAGFRNNQAAEGPAVYVADQDAAAEGAEVYHVNIETTQDLTFSGNAADSGSYANDIYLGKNANALLTAADATLTLGGGVMSDADGSSSITTSGNGRFVMGDGSFYYGSLQVEEGTVVIAGTTWGAGADSGAQITVLADNAGATLELQENAQVNATVTSHNILAVTGNATLGGDATLGGELVFTDSTLTVMGNLTLTEGVTFTLVDYAVGEHLLIDNYNSFSGSVENITLADSGRYGYTLELRDDDIYVTVVSLGTDLIWKGGKKASWGVDSATLWSGEEGDAVYQDGDHVHFTTPGTISIVGSVTPGSITVECNKSVTFKTSYNKKTQTYSGEIAGVDTVLTVNCGPKGKLTMNDGNTYGGGTKIMGGTVITKGADSFGTGDITITGGTLDLKSKAVANMIFLEGDAVIKGGKKFAGSLAVDGNLLKGSLLNIAAGQSATIFSGTINGTISGAGDTIITFNPEYYPEASAPVLDTKGKITTATLQLMENSQLIVSSKGLSMNSKVSAIEIYDGTLTSAGKISAYSLYMDGGELDVTNVKPMSVTLKGAFNVDNDAIVNLYGGLTVNQLALQDSMFTLGMSPEDEVFAKAKTQSVTVKGKGLLNTLTNSRMDIAGKMSVAGDLTLATASISLHDVTMDSKPKAMGLTVKGLLQLFGVSSLDMTGSLSAAALSATDANISIAEGSYWTAQSLKLTRKELSKGIAQMNVLTRSNVFVNGSMSVAGNLEMDASTINLSDYSGKNKAKGLTVKGDLKLQSDSVLDMTGTLSAAALSASQSRIYIAAADGLAAQNLKLTRKQIVKGVVQDNELTDSYIFLNGAMSVAGNLALSNSLLSLRDYSGKNKAKGLTVKGDLRLDSTSSLVLSGALSAKNLTLGSGSALTLTASKLSTVKVGGALTLEGAVAFDLGFTVTEKDVSKGKAYTLFSFKSVTGDISNLTLGYEGEYTLAFNAKGTAITLTVTDAEAWNAYAESVKEASLQIVPGVVAGAAVEEEETAEGLLTAPQPVAAAAVDPLLRKAADTLVQSTWGTVNASRAFGDTIAARGAHATLLAEGRGAAWLSTMGGSSRISTDGECNGADFTLSGAAFGVEGRVTEKSTLGVAIGNSWGKVSTFSAFPVDQDSMHIGIYGNHTLTESLTLSWMATHTRTESELNLLGLPYEWAQDALQLDARLTWATAISDKTTLSVFGGLQYLATDSGESNGLKTGSVQNLRGELGIGASHKCSDSTLVFGELSFVGDMVRNNPTADLGGMRLRGSNPGRAGINLSVGAAHRLSDDWSLNASYSFELMQNVTGHSLNVGASYSF